MSKVLITGGAGFIGFHLAKLLSQDEGNVVHLLDNFHRAVKDPELDSLLQKKNVILLERNILETDWQNGLDRDYDRIFHFAAIIGVAHVEKKPFDVLKNNTLMLLSLIDFARCQNRLSRFVFASTSEIYAGTLKHFSMQIPTPESTPLALTGLDQPRTSYMLSKIYGEALCYHSAIPFTVVRPHNFYGPRMGLSHVIPELLQRISASQEDAEVTVFSPTHKRTFCYIQDAVRMIKSLSESDKGLGSSFNIGNQSPEISMAELATKAAGIVGRKIRIKDGAVSPGSPERRCPDMSKTIQATGFADFTSLDSGIRETYEWYLKNVFSGKIQSAK